MLFLTPAWLKKARHLSKGVRKFIHYQSDLIPPDRMERVLDIRQRYDDALRRRDRTKAEELEPELLKTCEGAVAGYRNSPLRENIEVIIVAIVVALGIRAYFLQPFKIPTASMQPTLNGITAKAMAPEEPFPNYLVRAFEFVARGRNYVEVRIPEEWGTATLVGFRQRSTANFFTFTDLIFRDSAGREQKVSAYAPVRQLTSGLWLGPKPSFSRDVAEAISNGEEGRVLPVLHPQVIQGGTLLARGHVDTGDQVLVDKMSYHFRRPKRGEVFVFSTKGIDRIMDRTNPAFGSQHYIKRLAALPGDTVRIDPPNLVINGAVAAEPGFQRVSSGENGYSGYVNPQQTDRLDYLQPGEEKRLPDDQYLALGDNSPDSFDGRNWGPVPERNLAGPALVVYWPFLPHFGLIR